MKKGLSRMVANKRGTNPGGGAVRVSPGVYRQPMPQSQMAPPMQAPQGQQMGIGNFMQNQMQPQMQQGMAIPRPVAGGGYGYNSQQMAQDPMQQPSQQGYFSNQADVQSGKIPMSQGKQWIRG